jgi:hypothetical protein
MSKSKYGHYIKKLNFSKDCDGLYRQETQLSGKPFGLDFHVRYGTYIAAGGMRAESTASHAHDFDQIMVWIGTDTSDMGDLGAEVEVCLGTEAEKYMVTTSSSLAVPRGMPHFPATINRMDRRFIYMEVSCASDNKETPVPFDKKAFEAAPVEGWTGKYRKNLVDTAFIRKGPWHYGQKNQDDSGGSLAFITNTNVGFEFLIMCESIKKAPYRFGPIPDKPHAHTKPEILFFIGADTNDLSSLGAEIEIHLGKEMERHVITEPSAVVIPKLLLHNPLIITKIDRPFIMTDVRPLGSGEFAPGKL